MVITHTPLLERQRTFIVHLASSSLLLLFEGNGFGGLVDSVRSTNETQTHVLARDVQA